MLSSAIARQNVAADRRIVHLSSTSYLKYCITVTTLETIWSLNASIPPTLLISFPTTAPCKKIQHWKINHGTHCPHWNPQGIPTSHPFYCPRNSSNPYNPSKYSSMSTPLVLPPPHQSFTHTTITTDTSSTVKASVYSITNYPTLSNWKYHLEEVSWPLFLRVK